MEFYKILQQIMNEQDLSIGDVARACDIPEPTIRSIMFRKQNRVSLDVAFKLHYGLQVSLERLNGDQSEPVLPVHPRRRTDDPSIKTLVDVYSDLSGEGKQKVLDYAADIHGLKKYRAQPVK